MIKAIDDKELNALNRENLKHVATILKAMQEVLEDETKELDKSAAIGALEEALAMLSLVYGDMAADDERPNVYQIDVIRMGERLVRLATQSIDDTI